MIVSVSFILFAISCLALAKGEHRVGDMILTDDQFNAIPESEKAEQADDRSGRIDNGQKERRRRSAIKDEDYRWDDGVIPYRYDNSFNKREKATVKKAMNIWSKYTCLTFRPAKRNDKNWIKLINGEGCSSHVGMTDEEQEVTLQKQGCRDVATVLHELGHAIGLFHTQSRPDRDRFLRIDLSSVAEENHYNFEKKTWDEVHHYGVDYDYHSIMHYGSEDFGDASGKVLRTKDKKFQNVIGSATTLSFGDIEMVFKMYQCKPRSCNLRDSDCPGISFVGPSCKCLCPGPKKTELVTLCDEGGSTGDGGEGSGDGNKDQETTSSTAAVGGTTPIWEPTEGVTEAPDEWTPGNSFTFTTDAPVTAATTVWEPSQPVTEPADEWTPGHSSWGTTEEY